jgi:8-hydroxy-5-deazaflavin:NADPH oxidoreductase
VADTTTLGFLAGTGPLGLGLGLRLALAGHQVLIGSRSRDRAEAVVAELLDGRDLPIQGVTNAEAAERGEIVYLMCPWEGQADTLRPLAAAIGDKIAVSVVNPLGFDAAGPFVPAVPDGSAAQAAARQLPAARVVSAFHDVAAGKLRAVAKPVDTDVLVCGDDPEAKAVVIGHADAIEGVRGVDAGPLRLSAQLEGLTAVLVGINRRYRVRGGVRITGLSDAKRAAAHQAATP